MPLKHLARLLTILAMLVAPFGMLGGHAAAQTHGSEMAAANGHCAEMAGDHDQLPADTSPDQERDCRIACSCIPAVAADLVTAALLAQSPVLTSPAPGIAGLDSAADPPPPRLS